MDHKEISIGIFLLTPSSNNFLQEAWQLQRRMTAQYHKPDGKSSKSVGEICLHQACSNPIYNFLYNPFLCQALQEETQEDFPSLNLENSRVAILFIDIASKKQCTDRQHLCPRSFGQGSNDVIAGTGKMSHCPVFRNISHSIQKDL